MPAGFGNEFLLSLEGVEIRVDQNFGELQEL
jgi:hypothetical protein